MSAPPPTAKAALFPGVPTSDTDVWRAHPAWRWVYDRSVLARLQAVPCGLMPLEPRPEEYPVVLKPLVNLYGMGWQAHLLRDRNDWAAHWGHTGVWAPRRVGTHWSLDLVLDGEGEVAWWTAFEGRSTSLLGVFDVWRWRHQPDAVDVSALGWLVSRLGGFHGVLNVELIGDAVIEAHLRPGDVGLLCEDDLALRRALRASYDKKPWALGRGYVPRTRVQCLVPIWWPAQLPWPDAGLAPARGAALLRLCTEQPGATVSGMKRCALLVVSDETAGREYRTHIMRQATLAAMHVEDV